MSIVLKAKVRRPVHVEIDGEKTRLFPGDDFPFDPDERGHWTLHEKNWIELVRAKNEQADVTEILGRIEAIDGIGPATVAKIREALNGD